jgi:hypothetical protein
MRFNAVSRRCSVSCSVYVSFGIQVILCRATEEIQNLKLRDYSRLPPSPEEADDTRKALQRIELHPIAVAILGAITAEHELDELLRRRFKRNDDETWKELVSDNGPFGSFYAKIIAGYAFSIYDDKIRDDLHINRSSGINKATRKENS